MTEWLACHAAGRVFASWSGHHKNGRNRLPAWNTYRRLGSSAAVQPYRVKGQVVCGTVFWDTYYKRSHGTNRKRRVLYPSPEFPT